jgi:hypothetical protein
MHHKHPLSLLPMVGLALTTLGGCAYSDRIVFEADVNLRKGRLNAEYREETIWHQATDECADAAECVEGMAGEIQSALKDLGEDGAEDATMGYRLHDGELDRVTTFSADVDSEIMRDDMDWVHPLVVANRRGKERVALMVKAPPPDEDDDVIVTVEASGPHQILRIANDEGAVSSAWLFTRGRSHVKLTVDFTETDDGKAATRGWVPATPGLAEAMKEKDILVP